MNTTHTRGRRHDSRSKRRGIMLILFALLLAPMLALVGLTIDGGRIYFEKRRMQSAADGGAFGAAREILRGNDSFVVSGGRDDTKLNGFDDVLTDITVTVNRPPLTGPNAANNNAVEVIIDRPIPTTFMKIFMRQDTMVRARAVAGVVEELDPFCILALDKFAAGAITVSGTSDINTPDCTIIARSNNPSAITVNGGVSINAGGIGYGNFGGGYVQNGQGSVNPTPVPVPGPEDPYKNVAEPLAANYTVQSNAMLQTSTSMTLQPGVYNGGIKITGGDIVLDPGVYIVDGFAATGGTITGNGVMIFNMGTNKNNNISIGGNVQTDLHGIYESQTVAQGGTVPNDYEDMLFFNSRNAVVGNGNSGNADGTLLGTSDAIYDGIMYFPTVGLKYGGNANQTSPFALIIANTIDFAGTPQLGVNYTDNNRNPPLDQVSLLE